MLETIEVTNTRAIIDEVDLRGYCLNCIKKHAGIAHTLLVEVEQRLMQGSPVSDEKVKHKMNEVFENIAHIEFHTIVTTEVDDESRILLTDISKRANKIRAQLKNQEWALRVPEHAPKGSVEDISSMRLMLNDLQLVIDRSIYDYGCGDCSIEVFQKNLTTKLNMPIIDDKFINPELSHRGSNMSIVGRAVNTVFGRSLSKPLDQYISRIGLDGQLVSTALFSNVVGSILEVALDTGLNPGWGLLGSTIAGLGMLFGVSRYVSDPRAKLEWGNVGAFLTTRFIRASAAEMSQATSQLASVGRLALSNPMAALQSPFKTPAEISSIIEQRTRMVGGLNPANFLRSGSTNLRQVIVPSVQNEIPISPNRTFDTF